MYCKNLKYLDKNQLWQKSMIYIVDT